MKASLTQFVLAFAFLLAGCSGINWTVISQSSEDRPTDIVPDEAVSIVLSRYWHCDDSDTGDCGVDSSSESKEDDLADCMGKSLLKEQPKLRILPAKEFRRIAFPDKDFATTPRSPEAIIELLRDNEFKQRIVALHLRYLVMLDAETTSKQDPRHNYSDGPNGWVVAVGVGWNKSSTFKAAIVDMRDGVQSGFVEANSQGGSGAGLLFFLFPFPFVVYGPTESEACNALGRELGGKYFLNR